MGQSLDSTVLGTQSPGLSGLKPLKQKCDIFVALQIRVGSC